MCQRGVIAKNICEFLEGLEEKKQKKWGFFPFSVFKKINTGRVLKKINFKGNFKEGIEVINLSSCFLSCDVSLLTIITYFWAIQRGLQYFYGPFL